MPWTGRAHDAHRQVVPFTVFEELQSTMVRIALRMTGIFVDGKPLEFDGSGPLKFHGDKFAPIVRFFLVDDVQPGPRQVITSSIDEAGRGNVHLV